MEPYRIMGIDYGEARIGIALSDPLCLLAKPYSVIRNIPETVFEEILNVIRSQTVGRIVVGMPYHADGKESAKNQEVRDFISALRTRTDLPIAVIDECFTTVEANEELKKLGYDSRESKKYIDMVAAALILRSYLDSI